MTRSTRALLLSNVSLLMMLLVISIGMRQPLLNRFAVMERELMSKQVARVVDALSLVAEQMDGFAISEATWTEMHQYLGSDATAANSDFFETTYSDSVGEWLIEVLGLFDRQHQQRHLARVNRQTRQLEPADSQLAHDVAQLTELQSFPEHSEVSLTESRNVIFASVAGNPTLLITRPVLTSAGRGPRHGTVLVGKTIDSALMDRLLRNSSLSLLSLSLVDAQAPTATSLPRSNAAYASLDRAFFYSTQQFTLQDDWQRADVEVHADQKTAIRFSLLAPRLEYQHAQSMLNSLTIILFGIGITLGIVISWLIRRNFQHRQRLEDSQLALQQSNRELEALANLDGLTHLANRRFFDQRLQQEFTRAQRLQRPICVILCDIDHFKHYNDRYGHIAGDACLKQIAQILQNGVHRSTDVVARFGGEEFAIILPESDERGGIAIAQRMLSMIADSRIEHLGAPKHSVVSASFGVAATTPALGESVQSLLLLADQKLYEAKQAGRNRVANSQGS